MKASSIVGLCFALALLIVGDALFAWTAPGANPTAGNVAAPLNTGSASQIKAGGLGVGSLDVAGGAVVRGSMSVAAQMRAAQYCDVNGLNCITALPACGNGQTLIASGGGWVCGTAAGAPAGGPSPDALVNNLHTRTQCTDLGGTVVTSGTAAFCRFNQIACPSGWTPYENWSQTAAGTCGATNCGTRCTTPSHSFGNISPAGEFCSYIPGWVSIGKGECNTSSTALCRSTVTAIGCY